MKPFIAVTGLSLACAPVFSGIPLGRGEVFTAVTTTATYDSNVFGTPAPIGDFSGTLNPRLSYIRQAGLIESAATAGVSIIRYLKQTELDAENLDGSLTFSIPRSVRRNYSGSVSAAYLETSDLDTDLNARSNTQITNFSADTALITGTRSDFAFVADFSDTQRSIASAQQALTTELSYNYKNFFHGNSLRLAAGYDEFHSSGDNSTGTSLDQTAFSASVGLNRTFANETLRAAISAGYRVLNRSAAETTSGETQQGGTIFTASLDGPFLPKKYFPKIESRFDIAYQEATTPGINDSGSKEITGGLSLAWLARDTTTVSFFARRSQRLSADDLSVVSTRVQLGVDQKLRSHLTGMISAGYVWASYDAIGREDETASLDAGLRYNFARSWDASLSYSFTSTTSPVADSNYDRHLTRLSVTYRF